ncbi:sulfite exporter TauE/SafE family protein [Photobacterium sp. WH77]|uniref:sulfite exporter TauE/SafE family protein n=1 Tax=unclassified Photobacterium TaxID=2628852 RepID=UPI001EDC79D2|nr:MULTISPECIES: sulfite exporter TauE/SafE family protein [unclassified Photobacterium]MCG2838084.1 sulfite exporter TauE/SafE family protein [Photobacterium sp. WH77]MCG2845702.1 sulfite exporter TauE/SafE family protein [Photobacterium sp. WH80]
MGYDTTTIVTIMLVFTLAGMIKGVVGLGLPPVVLGLLTTVIGIHSAMSMVALPAFLTNIYQAVTGKHARSLSREHWLFFMSATVSVGVGCWLALMVDTAYMSFCLGVLLSLYAVTGLFNVRLSVRAKWQNAFGLAMGTCNGIFTGLTGSSAVPGVFYLQSAGLPKEKLVQAMGILFTFSSAGLMLGLFLQNILTFAASGLSLLALLPAFIGMAMGGRIRQRLSVIVFQRIFFSSLLLLGVYIIISQLKL